MSSSTRDTVLFWIKVSLGLTGILLMFGMLTCLIFFTIAQIRTLDEHRERDKAMLQQHMSVLADHDRAREQHALAFEQRVKDHAALMERLSQ